MRRTPSKKNNRILACTLLLFTVVCFVANSMTNYITIPSSMRFFDYSTESYADTDVVVDDNAFNNENRLVFMESEDGSLRLKKQAPSDSSSSRVKENTDLGIKVEEAPETSTILAVNSDDTQVISKKENVKIIEPSSTFNPSLSLQRILATSPVILFIRSSDQISLDLKNTLSSEYNFSPELMIVDLDKHSQGDAIQEYIQLKKLRTYKSNYEESSKSPSVPYLFINGASLINKSVRDDILTLHSDGLLLDKFREVSGENVLISKVNVPSNS